MEAASVPAPAFADPGYAAPAPASRFHITPQLPSISLLGVDFAAVSEQETVDHVIDEIRHGCGGWICTANLDILRQWSSSDEVRDLVRDADMIVADGMPVVWASSLRGTPLPERVAGSSLTYTLTAAAAQQGASIFLIGGNPGTAEAAADRLRELNPGLHVAGTLCPPVGFEKSKRWSSRIRRALHESDPDIVYVGLGFPKQERLIATLRGDHPHAWFVGCGISFSFIAGEFDRAPASVQRLGLEWLYRLVQEPGRLWRRYLVQDVPFLGRLLVSALADRRALRRLELEASKPTQLNA